MSRSNGVWGNGFHKGYSKGHESGLKTGGLLGLAVVGGIISYQNRYKIKQNIIVVRDKAIDLIDKLEDKLSK